MSVGKFISTGISTVKEQLKSVKETIHTQNLSILSFVGFCLRDSFPGAYYVFIKSEIEAVKRKNEIETVENETSQKVAFILGGYFLSPATLLPLKESLEKEGIKVVLLDKRQYSSASMKAYAKLLKSKLNEENSKDIVLFGYSSGGIIAHRIGNQLGLKSVSFGTPQEVDKTMVGTLLAGTSGKDTKEVVIPQSGINLVETFSFMVPRGDNLGEREKRLIDVYSHMTIGKESIVKAITDTIMTNFK